jgi:hypothetical protein
MTREIDKSSAASLFFTEMNRANGYCEIAKVGSLNGIQKNEIHGLLWTIPTAFFHLG